MNILDLFTILFDAATIGTKPDKPKSFWKITLPVFMLCCELPLTIGYLSTSGSSLSNLLLYWLAALALTLLIAYCLFLAQVFSSVKPSTFALWIIALAVFLGLSTAYCLG
ncbi:hypothetical protein [Hymenobacter metallicola]|nr:hypothetical protein [Hymenobacter metallicola]